MPDNETDSCGFEYGKASGSGYYDFSGDADHFFYTDNYRPAEDEFTEGAYIYNYESTNGYGYGFGLGGATGFGNEFFRGHGDETSWGCYMAKV